MSLYSDPEMMGPAYDAFIGIVTRQSHHGIEYNNSQLTGPGVDDTFDPDIQVSPMLAAGYWPGGIANTRHQYAMQGVNDFLDLGLDINQERIFTRELLLSATVGEAAMERYNNRSTAAAEKEVSRRLGVMLVPTLIDLCRVTEIPFSYVVVSRVLKSDQVEPGSRIASLYFPMGAPVRAALGQIRKQARSVIAEETL